MSRIALPGLAAIVTSAALALYALPAARHPEHTVCVLQADDPLDCYVRYHGRVVCVGCNHGAEELCKPVFHPSHPKLRPRNRATRLGT